MYMFFSILLLSINFIYAMPSKYFHETQTVEKPNCIYISLKPNEANLTFHTKEGINIRKYNEFMCGMESALVRKDSLKWIVFPLCGFIVFSLIISIIYKKNYKSQV